MRAKLLIIVMVLLVAVMSGDGKLFAQPSGAEGGEQLQQLANQLTREVFEIDWQLQAAEENKRQLQLELERLAMEQLNGYATIETLTAELDRRRERLGKWLRFVYRHGQVSLMGVLLEAESTTDFFTRRRLAMELLDYQTRLLEELRATQDARQEHQVAVARAAEINKQRLVEVEALERKLAALAGERQSVLESALDAEKNYGIEVLAREQRWARMADGLAQMLKVFQSLNWEQLKPRHVELNLPRGRAVAEFTQESLEEIVRGNQDGKGFSVKLSTAGLLLERGDGSESIAFQADLQVEQNLLKLQPKALTMDGEAISPEVVTKLVAGHDLTAPLPEVYPGVVAQGVRADTGFLIVEFGLGF